MNAKQRRTLERVCKQPPPVDIPWNDIVSLFQACGAIVSQGSSSRVRVALNGCRAIFHSPHPSHQTPPERVKDVRQFLVNAGVVQV